MPGCGLNQLATAVACRVPFYHDLVLCLQAEAAREARRAAAAELAELESQSKADKLNLERSWALRLEQVEQAWSERLQASLATANSRVEEWKQRAGVDVAKAAEHQVRRMV